MRRFHIRRVTGIDSAEAPIEPDIDGQELHPRGALLAFRLRNIDASRRISDARAPFLTAFDIVQPSLLTVHLTTRLKWGGSADPKFTADLMIGTPAAAPSELEAIGANVAAAFDAPSSPWHVTMVPSQELALPRCGAVRFIRQAALEEFGHDDARGLPSRFAHPGYGSWDRLIAAMSSLPMSTELFVTVTPTLPTPKERGQIESWRSIATLDDISDGTAARLVATARDAVDVMQSQTAVLQVMVVANGCLRDAAVSAIASALTAPYDVISTERGRFAAGHRRLLGGYVVDPARHPLGALELMARGRPFIGTTERSIRDLVSPDEISFLLGWPVGSDGVLPGIGSGYALQLKRATESSVVVGLLADGDKVHLDHVDRTQHVAVIGGSGSGKTSLLAGMALQDVEAGRCVWVIDSSGDLLRRVAAGVPPARRNQLTIIDAASDPIDSLDFLKLSDDPDRAQQLTACVHDGLVADLPTELHGPVGRYHLSALFAAMSRTGRTLEDLPFLLDDTRELSDIADTLAEREGFIGAKLSVVLSTLQRGDADHRADLVRWLQSKTPAITERPAVLSLGAAVPNRHLDDLLTPGAVVLIRPPHDADGSRRVSAIFLNLLATATRNRTLADPPIEVYLEEVHRYAGSVLRQLMNESRKRGICLHLTTQHLHNLGDEAEAVLSNAATILAGRLRGPQVARLETDLELLAGSIASLPSLHFRGRICQDGVPVGPVDLRVESRPGDPSSWPAWLNRDETGHSGPRERIPGRQVTMEEDRT
jgi:hypothetical protein